MANENLNQKQLKENISNEITTGLQNEVGTALANKTISDNILAKFNELATQGQLHFPANYSVGNALKLAYANIVSNGLQTCEPLSVANSLAEYVIQGLDVSRKQAYFIKYDNKCVMQRSYFGDVSTVKRTGLVKDVYAICVYKGDTFEIDFDENGRECVTKHETKFENRDNEIIGAYAVAVGINGYKLYCIMTRKEIEASWSMAKTEKSKFRANFQQEACKRTVIRRLVKMIFNTSVSSTEEVESIIASYNRSTEDEYDNSDSNERKYNDTKEIKDVIDVKANVVEEENPFVKEEPVVESKQETPIVEKKQPSSNYNDIDLTDLDMGYVD